MQRNCKNGNHFHLLQQLKSIPNCKCEYKKGKVTAFLPIRLVNEEYKYKLKIIIYEEFNYKIWIVEPEIATIQNGDKVPHVYWHDCKESVNKGFIKELCLCLHYPKYKEFNVKDPLIETIISWAIKWTEFYELWLLTGIWYGGGYHLTNGKEKIDTKQKEEQAT